MQKLPLPHAAGDDVPPYCSVRPYVESIQYVAGGRCWNQQTTNNKQYCTVELPSVRPSLDTGSIFPCASHCQAWPTSDKPQSHSTAPGICCSALTALARLRSPHDAPYHTRHPRTSTLCSTYELGIYTVQYDCICEVPDWIRSLATSF